MSEEPQGVVLPESADGRSSGALGRRVVADALRDVDPTGARQAEQETSWRAEYVGHFRRLFEAGLSSREAALSVAERGLASVRDRMRVQGPDGETSLDDWAPTPADPLSTVTVSGDSDPVEELVLPLRGQRLRGDDLAGQLDAWVSAGVLEPSAAEAVREVAAHPKWLRLDDWTVVVLGAGAEMGPLRALLRWGVRVAAVDLPRPDVWEGVMATTRGRAGTLLVPATLGTRDPASRRAGADLLTEAPRVADWLAGLDGRLVLGSYVYADGATHLRLSAAVDAMTTRLHGDRPDLALAFLATPTDVFAVPRDAVEQSTQRYQQRSALAKTAGRALRAATRGRLVSRAYPPDADPGINDSLVPQQGPNYALAKRIQRWRAMVAREQGLTVSMNVAPSTRTKSVVKNRALAAAYAGAHHFGLEIFEPATSNVLMAALLVHDLHTGGGPRHDHPWQDEAYAAVHGGLWRAAYAPRSVLGLAALLGYGSVRG
jgi:hypothetical protein